MWTITPRLIHLRSHSPDEHPINPHCLGPHCPAAGIHELPSRVSGRRRAAASGRSHACCACPLRVVVRFSAGAYRSSTAAAPPGRVGPYTNRAIGCAVSRPPGQRSGDGPGCGVSASELARGSVAQCPRSVFRAHEPEESASPVCSEWSAPPIGRMRTFRKATGPWSSWISKGAVATSSALLTMPVGVLSSTDR